VTDKQRLDLLADMRIFDGFGDVDIDEICLSLGDYSDDEEEKLWRKNWRKAFRIAIDKIVEWEKS